MKKYYHFIALTIAGIINALGVTIFLTPVELYDSGISGTSMILAQITPPWLSLSVFLIILNVPMFLYGLKKQGKEFTISAIYTVLVYSFFAWLITDILPIDVSIMSPLAGSDLFLWNRFRHGKRTGNKIWGSNGWNRSSGNYFCKKTGNYRRNICYDLQCGFIYYLWNHYAKLDSCAVFHGNLCGGAENHRLYY